MKKLILTTALIAVFLNGFCQDSESELHKIVINNYKNFIGSSLASVKSFWEQKVSVIYEHQRTVGDKTIEYYLMFGDGGAPDFDAVFKNNKCVEFSLNIYAKESSIVVAKLKATGYSFNKVDSVWENKSIKTWVGLKKIGTAYSQLVEVNYGIDDESSVTAEPVIKEKEAEFNNAISYYYRGVSKNESKNYKGAIIDFTKAINLDAKYNLAFNSRGFSKLVLGDYKGAIEDYSKSIELNPNDEVVFYERGSCKVKLKDYKGAIEDYSKSIELNPNDADTYYQRGNCKKLLGNKSDACLDFLKANNLGNTDANEQINKNCK